MLDGEQVYRPDSDLRQILYTTVYNSEPWAGSVLDGEQVYRPDSDLTQIYTVYNSEPWAGSVLDGEQVYHQERHPCKCPFFEAYCLKIKTLNFEFSFWRVFFGPW